MIEDIANEDSYQLSLMTAMELIAQSVAYCLCHYDEFLYLHFGPWQSQSYCLDSMNSLTYANVYNRCVILVHYYEKQNLKI